MSSFRFVHAADLHLDSPFKGLSKLPEKVVSVLRESTLAAFDRLVDLCIENEADFLLVAGDVYDEKDRSLRAQMKFQHGMEKLEQHGIKTFVIHGNHDPLDGYKAMLRWPESVSFFPADKVEAFPFYKDGKEVATIFGRSFPTRVVTENYASGYQKTNLHTFSIGLLHTNVDGSSEHDNYAPCTTKELVESGIDYWALGHIHTRSYRTIDKTHIVYPGNIQGRSIRETGERGCYIVDVDHDQHVSSKFVTTDAVRWEHERVSIADMKSEQDLFDLLEEKKEGIRTAAEGRPVLVRITFEGRGPLHHLLCDERKLSMVYDMLTQGEEGRPDFVWVESIKVRTAAAINREKLLQEEHILSDLLRYSDSIGHSEDLMKQMLDEALGSLLNHGRASRYVNEIDHHQLLEWMKGAEELAIQYLAAARGDDDES